MEEKVLTVNAGKTMIMNCGTGLDLLQCSGEFPWRTGVGSNSIFCNGSKHWVHKKCNGLKRLTKDPDYRCTQQALAVHFQPQCVKTAWKKFKELLPVLSSSHLSRHVAACTALCVWCVMLHASETWPLKSPHLQHLQQKDRAMIRQTCNVKLQDIVTTRSNELLARLGIEDLDIILKERRLCWYGHMV